MEKINYSKLIKNTLIKVLIMVSIAFIINNWVNIKLSFNGLVPGIDKWLQHSFTPSNIIVICAISCYFFISTLKKEKELLAIKAKHTKFKKS